MNLTDIITGLEREIAIREQAIAALRALNLDISTAPATHPAPAKRATPAQKKPRKGGGPRAAAWDVAKGRQMWEAGKGGAEIAKALGCKLSAIYNASSRENWQRKNGAAPAKAARLVDVGGLSAGDAAYALAHR